MTSPQKEWLSQQDKRPHAVENVKKGEASLEHGCDVCKLGIFLQRGLWKFLQNLNRTNMWSSDPTTDCPKKIPSAYQRDTDNPTFIAILSRIAKKQKQLKCPLKHR